MHWYCQQQNHTNNGAIKSTDYMLNLKVEKKVCGLLKYTPVAVIYKVEI